MRVPEARAPTHPGELLLEEFIKPLEISQTALAEWIDVSYPRLNEIIHGKRGVTPDTALRLEQVFGMDAQVWLNLQTVWDLYQAKTAESAKAIWKIRRHPKLARAGR